MEYSKFKEALAAAAKAEGITEYELYFQEQAEAGTNTFRQETDEFSTARRSGACFRCMIGEKTGSASTELFHREEAERLVKKAMENARCIGSKDFCPIYSGGGAYRKTETRETTPLSTPALMEASIGLAKAMYCTDSRITDGSSAYLNYQENTVRLYNSNGVDVSHTMKGYFVYAEAIAAENGETVQAGVVGAPLNPCEQKAFFVRAAVEAAAQLGAQPLVGGRYDIVFADKAALALLEGFFTIFSAEQAQNGLSLLKGKEEKKIAADCVTLVDDPFYPGSPYQMPFDAEGVPSFTKNIVENGVLKTLFHNLKSAGKAGGVSTGNAYKAGYSANVAVAPYYLYIKPGRESLGQLMEKAKDGVYITSLEGVGLGTNAVTGDFSLGCKGFLIKDGEIGAAVRDFTVAGNFFSYLMEIEAVGDTLLMSEEGRTSFGSPPVLVRGLSLAGR